MSVNVAYNKRRLAMCV